MIAIMMMPLEKQVCSLEPAKQLKALRVRQDSVFHWHWHRDQLPALLKDYENTHPAWDSCSAFTVAVLGELLPTRVFVPYKGKIPDRGYWFECGRHLGTVEPFWCRYKLAGTDKKLEYRADTEANVRAKMLIYLMENKLVTL